MGYCTTFNLWAMDAREDNKVVDEFDIEPVIQRIEEISGYRFSGQTTYGKWYDHQDGVLQLSREFPFYILVLEGQGEELGDYWRDYYLNGKMYRVTAQLPDVDISRFG